MGYIWLYKNHQEMEVLQEFAVALLFPVVPVMVARFLLGSKLCGSRDSPHRYQDCQAPQLPVAFGRDGGFTWG